MDYLLLDESEELWAGTYSHGLAHLNSQGHWEMFDEENSYLPDNYIHSLISDGLGGIWVGTSIGLAQRNFQGNWKVFKSENTALPGGVNTLVSDSSGGLWVGTGG
ncbi:two-component regulator propeller domain-containing protein, partial [Desulfamplus magnetovallimortis]|uniref:two-component regulator propeller domain-containing protein n=1 Tax=Desulfamplus magnetovallimortis TaxID=1246637 RepID=UPI001C97595D